MNIFLVHLLMSCWLLSNQTLFNYFVMRITYRKGGRKSALSRDDDDKKEREWFDD